MTPGIPDGVLEDYLEHALRGDSGSAVRTAMALLDCGTPSEVVIGDLLARAQREVGERWHRNEISVADEHLATGVTASALHALAGADLVASTSGLVMVTCAEGDWHAMAAHMFAEQIRVRGVAVVFLGASTPAEHVARFIQRHSPEALAVSCSLPLCFHGVTSLAEAAHEHGVPVIAGGRAFSGDPTRAARLGADAFAEDAGAATALLDSWRSAKPEFGGEVTLPESALELERAAKDLASAALPRLAALFPAIESYRGTQLARTLEDLAYIVQFAAAAELVGDATVFIQFLDWQTRLLEVRGVPASALEASLVALSPIVSEVSPSAGELLATGADHMSGAPASS